MIKCLSPGQVLRFCFEEVRTPFRRGAAIFDLMALQTAVVIGATGMVGELVTQKLLSDDTFAIVRLLVRKPVELQHPKLEVKLVNFKAEDDFKNSLGTGNAIFSCIGTTQKAVKGDKALYRATDHDIPAKAARFGKEAGFTTFAIVSSVGADAASSNFYLRLKGETEASVQKAGFSSLHIFRPSMITGYRKEYRAGEGLLQGGFKALSGLLFGGLRKYKAIAAADIAAAMVKAVKLAKGGNYIYEYDDIIRLKTL